MARLMEHVRLPLLPREYLVQRVEEEALVKNSSACKDYLIEAMKYHLLPTEQRMLMKSVRTRLRTPMNLPKLMVVVGGQAPKAIRSVECYDFKEERWHQVAELPSRRCRAGMVYMAGLVFAVGGFNGSLRVRTVDSYDPVKDQWTSVANMRDRRSTLGAAVLNGLLYAVGGFDGSTGLSSVEAYNIKSNEWFHVAPMNTRRSSVGVGVVGGLLYAVGGYDGASRQCLSTVECYNATANEWTYIAEMSTRRSGAGVGVLNNLLYAVGGHDGPLVRKSVEVYDPTTNAWRQVADMNMCRRNAGTRRLVATATPGAPLPRPVTPSRAPAAPRLQLRCDADDWLSARVSLSSLHPWSQWPAPPEFVDSSHTPPGRGTDQSLHLEGGADAGRTNYGRRGRPRPPSPAPEAGQVERRPLHRRALRRDHGQ
ncbi:kelch-like 2 Mayven [Cricetulus griseus]